jgi:endonuclease/exonuclease/phosphatase family metal-dependent hydrolase
MWPAQTALERARLCELRGSPEVKLVIWNMHDAGRAYSKRRHADAWRYLRDLNPDFALLQEARLPADAAEVWQGGLVFSPTWLVEPGNEKAWGSAVLSSSVSIVDCRDLARGPWLTEPQGGAAAIARTDGSDPLWLASLYSDAAPLGPERCELHKDTIRSLKLCEPPKVWAIELVAPELARLFGESAFICGGDLNSGLLFDKNYRKTTNQVLFENLAALGFVDLRTRHFAEEQRTFFAKNKGHYQLDHVFSDAATEAAARSWRVLTEAVERDLPLSDHAAIEVVVDLG